MPLPTYGVLKGRPIQQRLGVQANAHYQIHVVDETTDYRVAINVKSQESPSELAYLIVEGFQHPLTALLPDLPLGFHPLERRPGGAALDFIRGNLFAREQMRLLPFTVPGPNNDLNEAIDAPVQLALQEEEALLYAFGARWGPEPHTKDKIFGFLPGNGIHDIHMNQGNVGRYRDQDGVWQDGALLLHFPRPRHWVAVFLKFQSQSWHTDDRDGHAITPEPPPPPVPPHPGEPDGIVRIVAALVNPTGPAPEPETVTLLNTSPQPIDLDGWMLADQLKHKQLLTGRLGAGMAQVIPVSAPVQLSNKGGLITLLDRAGLKVDGVAYTEEQARRQGWTLVF